MREKKIQDRTSRTVREARSYGLCNGESQAIAREITRNGAGRKDALSLEGGAEG
jgi:hypothetical protein